MFTLGTVDAPASIHGMHTSRGTYILPDGTKAKYEIKARDIKGIEAAAFVLTMANDLAYMVGPINDALPAVLAELDTMRELRDADPAEYARVCIAFAILSANTNFMSNVAAVTRFMRRWRSGPAYVSVDDLYTTLGDTSDGLPSYSTGSGARPATALFRTLPWLETLDVSTMDYATLRTLNDKTQHVHGLGPKTCAFGMALWDAWAEVVTLDVHMLRGLCVAHDGTDGAAGSHTVTEDAYKILASGFIAWARSTFSADIPVFAIQWAAWNVWGMGHHTNHVQAFTA